MPFYEKKIWVKHYECDRLGRMKASALLRQVEQVSLEDSASAGVDSRVHQETSTAFILIGISLEMYRDIAPDELVTLTTMPTLPLHAVYHRYTAVADEQGNEVAGVDSHWVLYDTKAKRILRNPPACFQLPYLESPVRSNNFTVIPATEVLPVGEESALFSRTDKNGHMNNTEYADIICDHIPEKQILGQSVKRLVIHYRKELQAGKSMQVYMGQPGQDGLYYITGRHPNGKMCFEANLELGSFCCIYR